MLSTKLMLKNLINYAVSMITGAPLPPNDSALVEEIRRQVGVPAHPNKKVSRNDLKLNDSIFIHLDIGGEGVNKNMNCTSGFADSINVNASYKQSGPPYDPIPNLIQVQKWSTDPSYPFADGFADYITMQNAPLTEKNIAEIGRCLRPGGKVDLWIHSSFKEDIEKLATLLGGKPDYQVADEFNGSTGSVKVRIISQVKPKLTSIATPSAAITVAPPALKR